MPSLAYSSELVIYVDAVNGQNDSSCLQPRGPPCQSLEYVQQNVKSVTNHSVVIEICNPGINLIAALVFEDFVHLSIRGAGSMNQTTINCSTSYSGLTFFNITGLSLSFLQLTNCGAKGNSTVLNPFTHKILILTTAIYILNCTDVTINNSVLRRSNGTGISIYDTNGQVVIENTDILESFVRNTNPDLVVGGGGGMFIEFTKCTPGIVSNSCIHDEGHNSNAVYTICNCNFFLNAVNATTNSSNIWYWPLSSGGGAFISFASNATNITMKLINCVFQSNYASHYGGGLKVKFQDSVQNNKVSLINTMFSCNKVLSMGGGVQILFNFNKDNQFLNNNIVSFTLCDFKNNTAHSGGGVSILTSQIPLSDTQSAVTFSNSTWTSNTALYGSAVHIMPGVWASETDNHYPLFMFSNTNISSNKVIPITIITTEAKRVVPAAEDKRLPTWTNGAGAFFCAQINIIFSKITHFLSNNGTALYLSGSIARFKASSQVVFDSNNGTNGGAIALLGQSFLFLQSPSTFSFTNNTARQLGGGIYFQSTSQNAQEPCFIYSGFRPENSNVTFMSNRAGSGRGHHIYVSSFTSCDAFCENESIYDCIGNFFFNDPDNQTATATLPTKFSQNSSDIGPLMVFPGLSLPLPLIVTDLENNSVSNVVYEVVLKNKHSQIQTDPEFKYISNNTIKIQGLPQGKATLHLDVLSTDISLLMDIILAECPPGYVLENGKCECGAAYYYGILKCDSEAFLRYGMWMGRCNNTGTKLCTSFCPFDYCAPGEFYQPLPLDALLLEQTICLPTRTGIACGSCKTNYSVYYNSWTFECGKEDKCHLGVFFFILSTLIPLTILFLVIIVFDANVVNGWNGFLFFTQIIPFLSIHANGMIYFPTLTFKVLDSTLFIYTFFNLDFFDYHSLSFCLWKGATVMDILMVRLGCICFALGLVFITVFLLKQHKLAKCFPCLLRRRYTVINGLSAFFTLCYARCAWICFRILVPTCLYDDNFRCLKRVTFYSGNLEYFGGAHIPYAIVAITFLMFIVILPAILLLFYPLFFRFLGLCNLSESRAAIFLWRMMPIQLLDSFQNPFKNDYRCFAGLYFVYRAVALTLHLFTINLTQFFYALELQFIIVIFLHAAFQPYKKRLHNIIDLLLFFNLAFIHGITMYNYTTYVENKNRVLISTNGVDRWMIVQIVLLYLPLVSAASVVITKLLILLRKALKGNMYLPIQPRA